jgi:hypothetical protein
MTAAARHAFALAFSTITLNRWELYDQFLE